MSIPPASGPIEERLANRLSTEGSGGAALRALGVPVLRYVGRCDRAVYRSVARLSTPLLDKPLRGASGFANYSKPWFFVAGFLAFAGGRRGRYGAFAGLAAVGTASLVVNQPMKLLTARPRPDWDRLGVPVERRLAMPLSKSFPSGHSASAAAFAIAVGDVLPRLRVPLRAAASVVAVSRVYTGVHYPSDVIVGAAVGGLLGRGASRAVLRLGRRWDRRFTRSV